MKVLYFAVVIGILLLGLLTLVLQGRIDVVWVWRKTVLSLVMGAVGVAIFIVSRQPYAAAFAFAFLIIKAIMLIKRE